MLVRCSAPRLRAGERLQVQGAILASATSPLLPPGLREPPPAPDSPSSCPNPMRAVRITARVRVQGSGLLASRELTRLLWSPQTSPPFLAHAHSSRGGTCRPRWAGGQRMAKVVNARTLPSDWVGIPGGKIGHYFFLSTSSPSKPTDSSSTFFSAFVGAPSLYFQGSLWGKD